MNYGGHASAQAVLADGVDVVGQVQTGNGYYRLEMVAAGVLAIAEVTDAPGELHAELDEDEPAHAEEGEPVVGRTIDIMGVYSAAAREAAAPVFKKGQKRFIENEIQLGVDVTNAAFQRSGIVHRARLVHCHETSVLDETNAYITSIDDLLVWLKVNMTRPSEAIATARRNSGADIVSWWVTDAKGVCGVAHRPAAEYAVHGVNIVKRTCQFKYTFTHEVGHNLGGRHDLWEDPSVSPLSYQHGYVVKYPSTTSWYRTMMAYDTECIENGAYCNRLPIFSNPSDTLTHPTTGLSRALGHATYADVSRTINERAGIAADYSDFLP